MDLEQWVDELLKSIKVASDLESAFEIRLDVDAVKAIASAYDKVDWIEIY